MLPGLSRWNRRRTRYRQTVVSFLPVMDDFTPDAIEEGLWVARAPRGPEDYALIRGLGVADIVTLQTEDEARSVGLRPDVSFRLALAHGLREHRIGIEDFSPRDLAARTPDAAAVIAGLRARGRSVFVHCAAGLNRSPTVVAAVLAWTRGLDAREACARVVEAHPSHPDPEVVARALRVLKGRDTPPRIRR